MSAAIEGMTRQLRSWLPRARCEAAEALGRLGDPAAVPALILALDDRWPQVQAAAALALGCLGGSRALGPLVALLGSSRASSRLAAVAALGALGDTQAADALARAVSAMPDSGDLQDAARGALERLGVPLAQALGRLAADEKESARDGAIAALGHLRDDTAAIHELGVVLRDPAWEYRQRAARVLGRIGGPAAVEALVGATADEHPEVRLAAAEALIALGDARGIEPLLGVIGLRGHQPGLQACRERARALARFGADAVLPLLRSEEASRWLSIPEMALAQIGDHDLAAGVLRGLCSDDPKAIAALRSLDARARGGHERLAVGWAALGQEAAGDLDALLAHPARWVRAWAAEALGTIGGEESAARFAEMVASGEATTRLLGAIGASALGQAAPVDCLVAALSDRDVEVAKAAARALMRLGQPAVPALWALRQASLATGDQELRNACGKAIKQIRADILDGPTELLAASAPGGIGTELESAPAPGGRGTELETAPAPGGRGTELETAPAPAGRGTELQPAAAPPDSGVEPADAGDAT